MLISQRAFLVDASQETWRDHPSNSVSKKRNRGKREIGYPPAFPFVTKYAEYQRVRPDSNVFEPQYQLQWHSHRQESTYSYSQITIQGFQWLLYWISFSQLKYDLQDVDCCTKPLSLHIMKVKIEKLEHWMGKYCLISTSMYITSMLGAWKRHFYYLGFLNCYCEWYSHLWWAQWNLLYGLMKLMHSMYHLRW